MKKTHLLIAILILCSQLLLSQKESRNSRGYSNYLGIAGCYIQGHDDKYSNLASSSFTNSGNRAVIELGLDEDKHISHTSALRICATFDVALTDASLTTTVLSNQQLDISYNPADLSRYKDKAQLIFPDKYKIKVYNISISYCASTVACASCLTSYTLGDAYLEARIETARTYTLGIASAFSVAQLSDSLTTNDQLKITWPFLAGATAYELEYTFIDDYGSTLTSSTASTVLTYDLEHDATRIVTNKNHYYIPLTYERGYIVYRIRPTGLNSALQRTEGAWYPVTSSGTVSAATCVRAVNSSFPAAKLNWQSSKTFAESGKTGTGVEFTDAMGLPRQSLARLNSESKTLVQSGLFDFYGRPVVQILPAPVSGLDFNYRFGLNVYTTSTTFDKLIFDRSNTNSFCSPASFSLSSSASAGAAKYYSANNPNKEAMQGYLPDAGGIPFTQLQYTNDGLNLVAKTTLPGKLHQLGLGKEIRYCYTNPAQVEMDRIFGSEAGRSNYYHKVSTTDPNGQMSLEYKDMFGRTVATCLKGLQPSNVDALSNITGTASLVQNLMDGALNFTNTSTGCTELNTNFEVTNSNTLQAMVYEASWGSAFTTTCDPIAPICYHCVYDVTITITDDCGTERFDHDGNGVIAAAGYTGLLGRQAPYSNTISCSQPTSTYVTGVALSGSVSIQFPHPGKYKVYKKICVSEAPLEDYTNTMLQSTCGPDKCQIFNGLLNSIDFSGCLPKTCQSCTAAVASTSSIATPTMSFPYQGPLEGGLQPGGLDGDHTPMPGNGSTAAVFTYTQTPQELSKAYEECGIYCPSNDRCSNYQKLMEADFYPGTGQFATTNTASATWSLSIFNPANSLPTSPGGSGVTTWSNSTLAFVNAIGQTDWVQINGINKHPYELTQAQFIQYFRKSWAKAFLNRHPESCTYNFYCSMMSDAIEYDDKLSKIQHSDGACVNGGYWFPLRYASYSNYRPAGSCTASPTGIDPISMLTFTTVLPFRTAISNFTYEVTQNFRNTNRDIYEFTAMQSQTAIAGPTPPAYSLGQDQCTADNDWNMFKQFYLTSKEILYQKLLSVVSASRSAFGIDNLACLPPTGFKSHFPAPLKMIDGQFPATSGTLSSTFYTTAINPPSYTNTAAWATYTASMNQFTNQVVPSPTYAASQCSIACNSYTNSWDATLRITCPAYSSVSASTQTAILSAMVGVCLLGCDYSTSLLGSSSVPTGTFCTLPTSQTVSTFQDILNHYLPGGSCNSIVINNIAPYPVTPGDHELTSCRCDLLLEVAADYAASPTYSTTMLEWELFEQRYGFDLPEYYKLRCACQGAVSNSWVPGNWTAPQATVLAAYATRVDDRLQCKSCLSCTDVAVAINSFTASLPVPLSGSSYTNIADLIRLEIRNKLFAHASLNQVFGLHSLQTYLDLYEDCSAFTSSRTFSNTVTQTGRDVFNYLTAISKEKTFLKPHAMTLCTDDPFFLSTLYSGPLPIIQSSSYAATPSSNSLTIVITGSAGTLASILLVKPTGAAGGWADLSNLGSFAAYCPPPLVQGANYRFIARAQDQLLATISLTGVITCTSWPVSYFSSGAYTVPTLCPPAELPQKNPCVVSLISCAKASADLEYKKQAADLATKFRAGYKNYCLGSLQEIFTRSYRGGDEYNYTLYYYDQAGNLQRTVPPNGADPNILTGITTSLSPTTTLYPAYSSSTAVNLQFVNDYQYDSYNNLIQEKTVDGGKTTYYYDLAGRLMASQNAAQAAASSTTGSYYSYSLYDNMGRIYESGKALVAVSNLTVFSQYEPKEYNAVLTASSTLKSEMTSVYYDRATSTNSVLAAFMGSVQNNLRNRVAYITYKDVYNSSPAIYDHATYYSYDDHGNVTELVQHNRQLDPFKQGFRSIQYDFELISGNMIKASYQSKKPDQFLHKYYYDADNRLKEVYTSKDDINWDRDAKYFYYEHGPLARVERADKKVQGTDYLYTIHGWIKGINSDALNRTSDGGKDGTGGSRYLSQYPDVHNWIAGDAMGFSLNYYNTAGSPDYKAIKTYTADDLNPLMPVGQFSNTANTFNFSSEGADLYNGNIGSMNTVFIDKDPVNTITQNSAFPMLTAYRYDQLQRLKSMKAFHSYSAGTPSWNPGSSANYRDGYKMSLSYDNNGNILSLLRNGPSTLIVSGASLAMDDLSYKYYNSSVYNVVSSATTSLPYNSNKLRCLTDVVSSGNYGTDVDTYSCTPYESVSTSSSAAVGVVRYGYDAIGNLIYDRGEYIAKIEWTVDRKVKRIIRDSTAMTSAGVFYPDVQYEYNSQRQRVMKLVKPRTASSRTLSPSQYWTYTYYVYDASGNVMGTYDRTSAQVSGSTYKDVLTLKEQPVYGSSRLALARPGNTFASWTYTFNAACGSGSCRQVPTVSVTPDYTLPVSGYLASRNLGYKDFELSNHLGNVITTVSDRQIPATFGTSQGSSNCSRSYDFSSGVPPFGDIRDNNMTVSTSGGSLVCTIQSGYGISGINPNLGNYLSTSTVYQIEFDFDPGSLDASDGLYLVGFDYDPWTGFLVNNSSYWSTGSSHPAGHYTFTYTPTYVGYNYYTHIAFNTNSSSTHTFAVDNIKMCAGSSIVTSYSADVVSNTDYYPGGMEIPGRNWTGGDEYRYSHNGQEHQDEVFLGALSAEHWMYDSRTLRRWEIDPMTYEWQSPYACYDNNPILLADPDGLYGDPYGIQATKNAPKISPKSFGATTAENIEKSIAQEVAKNVLMKLVANSTIASGIINVITDGTNRPSSDNATRLEIENAIKYYGAAQDGMSAFELDQLKQRVEQGKGDWMDNQTYNRKIAPFTTGLPVQSHHVIPANILKKVSNPLIAVANKDPEFFKWADKKSNTLNRILLTTDVHLGSHGEYDDFVENKIQQHSDEHPNLTPEQAKDYIIELMGEMKGLIVESIINNPGMSLHNIFKAYNEGKAEPGKKINSPDKGPSRAPKQRTSSL